MVESREVSRESRAKQIKDAILDAAIGVFAKKGFEGGSLSEIASLSGSKQPLIVYHFGNKELLWEEAVSRLVAKFDALQERYFAKEPEAGNDRERLRASLSSFINTLRDIPEYGELLLKEGSHPSPRTRWIDHHYQPRVYKNTKFDDPELRRIFSSVNLLRYAMTGAALFIVVAGPQISMSAAEAGGASDSPEELYPLSDSLAGKLTDMLIEFFFHQLAVESKASGKPSPGR